MAKEQERKLAHWLFVQKGKSLKEIKEQVNVSMKTLSAWVNKYNWKAERTALLSSPEQRIDNIKQIITTLADERLELSNKLKQAEQDKDKEQITEIRSQIARIDTAVANWNKTLAQLDKDAQVTLTQYLYVMDSIFSALRNYDEKLFLKTLDFQELHVREVAIKLG